MNGILSHGLGGRSDLPVPLWLAVYGGASAVVLSFLVLGAFWLTPKLKGESAGRPIPEAVQRVIDARPTRIALRALGVLLFAITVLAAIWALATLRGAAANTDLAAEHEHELR